MGLWSNVIETTFWGDLIRDRQELFVSKKIFATHIGYAEGQITRMKKGHCYKSRQKILEEYGYDTKYAMHALRLVLQGQELAETASIAIPIPEPTRTLLMDLRAGKYTQEEFYDMFETELHKLRGMEDTSELRPAPDIDAINDLLQWIYRGYYGFD